MWHRHFILIYFTFVLSHIYTKTYAQTNGMIKCGACKLIINELENGIKSIDPKKKVKIGSYRVDPHGNQLLNEVPYARSEVHMHELLDTVCEKTAMYGQASHPVTKKQLIVNMQVVGESNNRMIIDASNDIKSTLRSACDDIIDQDEDAIVKLLGKEYKDPDELFCYRERSYCQKDDFIPFPPATPPPTESESDKLKSDEL